MSINHRRISLTIASSLFLEVINKISPLLILHHAQKTLGLPDFGWAQIQLALFETLQPLVTYGFASYALAETSSKGDETPHLQNLFSHIFVAKIINAALVSILYLASLHARGSVIDATSLGILAIVMLAGVFDFYWIAVVKHKIANISLISGLFRIISLIAILTFVKDPGDKALFVGLSLIPNALISIGTGLISFRFLKFSRLAWPRIKEIFYKASPFALLVLVITILERADIFAVERSYGLAVAGAYAGPAKVVQSLSMVISSLSLPFFAEILKVNDRDTLAKHVSLSLWCLSALIAPIVFGMPFIEADVIHILFTNVSSSVDHIVSLLSVGMIGTIFVSVFGLQLLMAKGRPWPIVKACLVYVVLVPLAIWMGRDQFGLQAVALSVIVGKILVGLACLYAAKGYLPKIPWLTFFKPFMAGACMGLVLWLSHLDGLILNIAVGGVAYAIAMLVSNFREFKEIAKHPRLKRYFERWL